MAKITGSNVTIMVRDMDRSIHFYESIGLHLKQRWDDHYAMLTAEGITLGIHPASDSMHKDAGLQSGTVSIGFMIKDMKEAKELLDRNNILYNEQDDGKSGIYLHFTDPDGTVLYFVQPKW